MAASKGIAIEQLYTLDPDKPPIQGSLAPGEVAWELGSHPIKQWIGVPTSVNADQQVLLTTPEPVLNGAYLRVQTGAVVDWVEYPSVIPGSQNWYPILIQPGTAAWENLIIHETEYGGESAKPVLQFVGQDTSDTPLFATEQYTRRSSVTFSALVPDAADYHPLGPASLYAIGNVPSLFIDYAGSYTGVLVDNDGQGSRGIEIQRGPDSSASLRLVHKYVPGFAGSPPDYLMGDLVFAGATGRNGAVRNDGAKIQGVTTQPWTNANRGTRLEFWTTPNNSQTPVKSLVLDHDGGLQVMHSGSLTALDSLFGGSGGVTAPTGPLVSSNGTVLGSLAVGGTLAVTGTFPSQTLNVSVDVGLAEDNTWLGEGALALIRTSNMWEGNVAIGAYTLGKTTPLISGNVAVGAYAMYNNVTGYGNIAIGFSAMYDNIAGSNNIAIGGLEQNFNGSHNVAIGGGTSSTGSAGHLENADGSVFVGVAAKALNDTSENEIVIGWNAVGHGDDTITLGNGDITALHCQQQAITALSDPRLKDDIEPADLDRCLAAVEGLPVYRYGWKETAGAHRDKHVTGWLPDEVAKVFPKAVSTLPRRVSGGVLEDCQYITMSEALPTLWGAVQRLSRKIRELEGEHDG